MSEFTVLLCFDVFATFNDCRFCLPSLSLCRWNSLRKNKIVWSVGCYRKDNTVQARVQVDLLLAVCCRWFFNASYPRNDAQSSHAQLVVDIEHVRQLCTACSEVGRDRLVNGQLVLMLGVWDCCADYDRYNYTVSLNADSVLDCVRL